MSTPIIIIPGWFDIRGAHAYCGICITNLKAAVKSGELKTRFQGGKRLISRVSLDAWIESGDGKREMKRKGGAQ